MDAVDGRDGDKERLGFFFAREEDKGTYSNGCYHATPEGYWRIRGRPARVRQCGRTIAFKTPMDFYRGRPPHGYRTPWSMFEYALYAADWRNDGLRNTTQPWVSQRLYKENSCHCGHLWFQMIRSSFHAQLSVLRVVGCC